jgi:hypothetical protein
MTMNTQQQIKTIDLYKTFNHSWIYYFRFICYCTIYYFWCISIVNGQEQNTTTTTTNNNTTLTSIERDCIQSIVDSDSNSDRLLNPTEFTTFRQDLCNNTKTTISTTNTSIETSTFLALACVCQQEEEEQQGNNSNISDCCVGTRARINVSGIVRILNDDDEPANATTLSLLQRFNSICLVVRSSCISDSTGFVSFSSEVPSMSPNIDTTGGILNNSSRSSDIPSLGPTTLNETSDIPSIVPSIIPSQSPIILVDTSIIIPTERPRRQSRQPESTSSSSSPLHYFGSKLRRAENQYSTLSLFISCNIFLITITCTYHTLSLTWFLTSLNEKSIKSRQSMSYVQFLW